MYLLLCVILVWPTKFENSLNYMQNVFETWKFQENCLTILFLGKLGSKQMFLKNISSHTHAFLCIKFNALMSFCINLLCFSIFFFFKEFWSIKLVSRLIEITIKILVSLYLFQSVLDWCWINRSIFDRSNLFFDQSKVVLRFFFF